MKALQLKRITLSVSLGWVFLLAGCGNPIYDSVTFDPESIDLGLTSGNDSSRYEWPQTRDGYVVAKPPQMAYVTSFTEKLSRPDPSTANLVPWSTDGLDVDMLQMLDEAYKPASLDLDVTLSLDESQFIGPDAFDVSSDGTRLVVIDDQGLALYKTENGSLIGHMKLPPEITSSKSPIQAVRFGGATKDMLVASSEKIVRISSMDGSVTGETKGCGEPIAQWIVNNDDKSMLVRSVSGRLFGGDPQLEFFSAYNVGNNVTFETASLSPDGTRIGVLMNRKPRTYIQDAFQIVDEIDYEIIADGPSISIALGISSDAWADGDGVFYTTPNEDGGRKRSGYNMFWKPLQISITVEQDTQNSYIVVGRRFVDGKEQVVLFDYGAISRSSALPKRLDEVPIRFAHSRRGDQIAIVDSRGLRLCKREVWRTEGPVLLDHKIYNWTDRRKFAEIEKMISIIKSQDRLGFGRSSEELRTFFINAMADRWRYLTENHPKDSLLPDLDKWLEEGSQLALVTSAVRRYKLAWNARGGGFASTVTSAGWTDYNKNIKLAAGELDKAIEMGEPPLTALDHRVKVGLEQKGDLATVDPFCRRAAELYPGEVDPHASILFKLTPQWFGEPGDVLSFALSVSKMLAGSESDLLYARLVGDACRFVHHQNKYEWNSYDRNRIRRGVDEIIRRRVYAYGSLWMLWRQIVMRTRDAEMAEYALGHVMANQAAPPHYMTHGDYAHAAQQLYDMAKKIRSQ